MSKPPKVISRKEAKAKGLTNFYTGRPCNRGHLSPRLVSNGNCIECGRHHYHKTGKVDVRKSMVRAARYRAKARGLPFDLTYTDIIIPSHCPCCAIKLVSIADRPAPTGRPHDDSPSLDRIVPILGYIPSNVAVLCMRCNILKSGITEQMLFFLLEYVQKKPQYNPEPPTQPPQGDL